MGYSTAMTNPFNNSSLPQNSSNNQPQQSHQYQQPQDGWGQPNPPQPGFGQGNAPVQKRGSNPAMWIILGSVVAVLLIAGMLFALLKVSGDGGGLGLLSGGDSAWDDEYWEQPITAQKAKSIRQEDVVTDTPKALEGLPTTSCTESASFFGAVDADSAEELPWVRSVDCRFGDDEEFSAQYTENSDAIASVEEVGLNSSFDGLSTARGSTLGFYETGDEFVLVEVLKGEKAVIEYILDDTDLADIDERDVDFTEALEEAGIVEWEE